METGAFEHRGVWYGFTTEMVDTDYGGERLVRFFLDAELIARYQEPASTETIIRWFKESLDES